MTQAASVRVDTTEPYEVHIGSGILALAASELSARDAFCILTDENVERLHGDALRGVGEAGRIVVPPGESSKTLARLENVLDALVDAGLSRASALIAFGGGVVGDLGGLAASLYQRGIDFVQVPTTLLAQVDSSVGGKTAVNLEGGKNLAGTFHQPRVVFADSEALKTLPDNEYRSGLGEVIKSALVGDPQLLEFLEQEHESVLARDGAALCQVVERCVRVKASIVTQDEHEGGLRKSLNLGHTFAHAIEHAGGYGKIPHGIAVAVGLVLATRASIALGLCDQALEQRLIELNETYSLPASIQALRDSYQAKLPAAALAEGMRHDKKGISGKPQFVLLEAPGLVALDVAIEPGLLSSLLA